ncbi:MAG: phage major tail tube protein [Rhabdaerophilum sp.]
MPDLYTYEGFNLFAMNVNKSLVLKTLNTGKLTEKMEKFHPGFSNMEIELGMGLEAPAFEFETVGDDIETLALFGFGAGTVQNFSAYKASKGRYEAGAVRQTIINVRGRLVSAEGDNMEGGKLSGTKFKVAEIQLYRHVHQGKLIHEYDITRGGNTKTRAEINAALGM